LLAARGFAVAASMGGARQHAVLGGYPALALAAQEAGHPVLDAGVAQHAGLAEGDQHRALRMTCVAALDADFAQLVGRAAAGAGNAHAWISGINKGRQITIASPDALDIRCRSAA